MARILITAGLLLIVAGALIWLMGGKPGWFGHLPGDLRIERPNYRIYFPFATLILLSILLNLLLWIAARLRR